MSSPKVSSAKSSAAKVGALGFMAVALGCAAFAAYLIGDMMSSSYTGTKVVPLVVAQSDIKAGTPISDEMFVVKEWPEDSIPANAFGTVEALMERHAGAPATVAIMAGEPVLSSKLAGSKTGTGIAALLQPNMRAFALKVDDSIGFTGLVYPGAYVDVVATVRDPFGRGPSSRIAVQNARVLSLGMDADVATRRVREQSADKLTGTPQQGGTFVTLEVTPEEAEVLSIAKTEGTIDVVLRNATDDAVVETEGATPNTFSAFAPSADDDVDLAMSDNKPDEKKTRRKLKRKKRRIQLVASDESDTPKKSSPRPSSAIETYNAN